LGIGSALVSNLLESIRSHANAESSTSVSEAGRMSTKEHQRDLQPCQPERSVVVDQSVNRGHGIQVDNTTILANLPHYTSTVIP
jgi:hypothetical protein